jgi:hypothetical protein
MVLTVGTALNVIGDILAHLRPPVISFHDLYRLTDTWVTVYWQVMMSLDEFPFSGYFGCYDNSVSFVPCPINAFELMGVNPWFEALFVLLVLVRSGHDCVGENMFR